MAGRRGSILPLCLLTSSIVPIFSANASESVNYTYDARGRLVQVSRSGTVNNGVQASYSYDKADNRTNVTVVTGGNGTTLTLGPASLPNGTVGTAYSQTIAASGGTGPYSYAKTAGTIPSGLSLNGTTGVLSGTPTTAATSSFTITATDTTSNTGSRAYSVLTSSAATCSGVSFSVSNAANEEGIPLGFVVTKSSGTGSCSVSYATANYTAVAPGDYTAIATTVLNFAAGETAKTVYVTTFTTGPTEGTETMYLNLSSPTGGATISDSQGVGTIYNYYDDGGGGCPPEGCPLQAEPPEGG